MYGIWFLMYGIWFLMYGLSTDAEENESDAGLEHMF